MRQCFGLIVAAIFATSQQPSSCCFVTLIAEMTIAADLLHVDEQAFDFAAHY